MMVKIKYRGPKLLDPDMKDLKDVVNNLKKDIKGLKCSAHHRDKLSTIHLRYIKETGELEKHVNACCYDFENMLKERLPDLHQVIE